MFTTRKENCYVYDAILQRATMVVQTEVTV